MSESKKDYHLNFLHHHLPTDEGRRAYAHEAAIMSVANALVDAVTASGRSQAWIAERLGRTPGFVSQVLSGSRNMTIKTLADFAYALELELHGLRLIPLGESLVPHEKMDQWLDEESVSARGTSEIVGTTEYRPAAEVQAMGHEPATAYVG